MINVLKLCLYSVVSVIFVFNHIWDDDPNLFCSCLAVWTPPQPAHLTYSESGFALVTTEENSPDLNIYIYTPTCCCSNHSLPAIHSSLVKCLFCWLKIPIYNVHVLPTFCCLVFGWDFLGKRQLHRFRRLGSAVPKTLVDIVTFQ